MHSSLVWATLAASLCRANPIASAPLVQAISDHGDLVVRQLADVPSTSVVKREDVSFDLTTSYNNTEIFDGSWVESIDGVTNTVSLALTCLECYLAGTVTASVVDSDDLALRLDFADVEGYFDLGLTVSDTATYTYTIYSTESPVGVSFTSGVVDVSIGLVLYVDLVFSLSAEVDLEGGFTVQIADGSYLETDILAGTISNSVFSGTSVQAIPVTLKSGEATFQADLRLRAECGADAEVLGLGVDAELGVYANLLEFIVEAETSDDCDLLLVETWDINAGAYIDVDVVIDYSTFGAVPTVSTTLYLGTTYSQCIGAAATATASVAELAELSVADSASITAIAAAVAVTASEDVSASVTASAAVVLPTGYASASGDVSYSHYFVNGSFASATGAVSGSGSGSVSGAVSGVASASGAASASASASVSGAVYASLSGNSSVTTSAVSTVYSTSVYTITSCAATVINCPASLQTQIVVTKVVTDYTTVCPVTASASASASSASASVSSASSASAATVKGAEAVATSASASVATAASKTSSAATQPTKVVITDVYVVVPCATPIVATYTPPTSVPSIVISVIGQSSVSGSSVSSAVSSVATSAKVSTVTKASTVSVTAKASTASTAATAATVSTAATASTAAKASTVSAETEASTAATEASTVSAEAVNAVAATSSASASVATFYGNGTSNGAAAKSGFVTGLATGLATGAATSKTAAASVSSPAILAVSATPVVGAASATASSKTSSTATAATAVVTAGAGHAMTGSFVAVVGAVAAALLLL